ncbi:hypothetical protein ES319_A13G137800v1 [Gossypium barbadense]|uniref:Uncharacterized protein n=2 Tax=Gossypium TaxID=3633 RepID=A0A5J5T3R9_GOSBA|nr:hypothetical protein ES319_A13G137800v1 [Gossypium barbadense]TYG86599.1 hypothetical protein ES288_A13G146500v1 [Gossypium darwinii]
MLDPVHPAYWESFSFLSPLQIFYNPLFFVLRTKVNVNDFLCCVLRERTKMEGRTIDRTMSLLLASFHVFPIPSIKTPIPTSFFFVLKGHHNLLSLNLALEPTFSLVLANFHVFPSPSIKRPIPTSFFLC